MIKENHLIICCGRGLSHSPRYFSTNWLGQYLALTNDLNKRTGSSFLEKAKVQEEHTLRKTLDRCLRGFYQNLRIVCMTQTRFVNASSVKRFSLVSVVGTRRPRGMLIVATHLFFFFVQSGVSNFVKIGA